MNINMATEQVDQRDSKQVYDKAAKDFRSKAPELLTYKYIVRPSLEKAMDEHFTGDRGALSVLDIGSASGRNVNTLIEEGFKAENILGVEISPEQVKIAKSEIPEASFEVGDISAHKLAPERNDLAIMVMVAEFLDKDKYPQALDNILSSMKPGGVFVCVTTHQKRYEAKYGAKEGSAEVTTRGPWSEDKFSNYVRSVDEQKKAFKEAGFVVEEVEELRIPDEVDEEDRQRRAEFTLPEPYARLTIIAKRPETTTTTAA